MRPETALHPIGGAGGSAPVAMAEEEDEEGERV